MRALLIELIRSLYIFLTCDKAGVLLIILIGKSEANLIGLKDIDLIFI